MSHEVSEDPKDMFTDYKDITSMLIATRNPEISEMYADNPNIEVLRVNGEGLKEVHSYVDTRGETTYPLVVIDSTAIDELFELSMLQDKIQKKFGKSYVLVMDAEFKLITEAHQAKRVEGEKCLPVDHYNLVQAGKPMPRVLHGLYKQMERLGYQRQEPNKH